MLQDGAYCFELDMLDEDYDYDAYGNIQILALSKSVDDEDKS